MPVYCGGIRPLKEDETGRAMSSCSSQGGAGRHNGLNILFTMFKYLLYLKVFNEETTDGILENEVQST